MKRPAIFFDRDNTLIISDGYLGDPNQVTLVTGAADAVARARSLGFATVVVSNQSGVARGLFSENDVHLVNRRVDELLQANNSSAIIDRHEFCPYHPDASIEQYRRESELRKPKPGMIYAAAEKMALDLSRSWVIGDAPRDIEAGIAAGCRTILLQLPDLPASPASTAKLKTPPDCIVTSLQEAIDFIERTLDAPSDVMTSTEEIVTAPDPEPVAAIEPPNGSDVPMVSQAADDPTEPASASAAPVRTDPAIISPVKFDRLEHLAEQILMELKQRNQHADYADFSISKLMAGIVQVLSVALMFISYLYLDKPSFFQLIAFAVFLQILTISLLIMGRQR